MTITPAWMAAPVARPCAAAPERWFSADRKDQNSAIALCQRCPLLTPCQEYALEERPSHGIWGGLTERARRADTSRAAEPRRSSLVPVDCDSPTSWAQHRRRGETCDACQTKRTDQLTQERRARLDAEHAAHGGSMIGYHAHKALGEAPCSACREVNRARCEADRAVRQGRRRRRTTPTVRANAA